MPALELKRVPYISRLLSFSAGAYFMSALRAATRPAAEGLKLGLLPIEKVCPRLSAWVARIEALPGYAKTFPPHWR